MIVQRNFGVVYYSVAYTVFFFNEEHLKIKKKLIIFKPIVRENQTIVFIYVAI